MTQDTRGKRRRACGGLGAALAVLAVVGAWAPGCSLPRRAEFEDDALLLGLDGSYELDVHDLGDPADYTLRVEGESVSASLGHAEGWFGPRGALFADAVAEGVSVVELRLRGRVLDRLTVEVAAVDRVRAELVLDPAAIRAVHIELASDRLIWVAGITSEGLQVVLLDADVEVDGESRPPVGLAVYNVGVDSPPGTVITATWSGLSDTYTF